MTESDQPSFPRSASGPGPLDGVRVLDLTRVLSGPHTGRMLCDLGADVIKVEPPAGDITRFPYPRVAGLSGYYIQQNTGKRNISLDLGTTEAVDLLRRLAARCDVVIENFRSGVMDRMGLGYDVLAADNPRLIYASINGYGSTGPWRHRRAYASVVGAETGMTKAQGDARVHGNAVEYVNDPHSHADVYTALETAGSILAALYHREKTGRGQRIEVSMAETMLYVNEHVNDHLWDGDVPIDVIRSFQPGDYPVLTVGDGSTIVISGHPAERGTFDRVISAMNMPDLKDDSRFDTVGKRLAHIDDLMSIMRGWALTCPDAATIEKMLDDNELAMGVLRSVREIAATEWAAAREAIVTVSDRNGGQVRIPNSPWRFSEATTGVRGEPKYRGEDNADVLREYLGLDDATLARLAAEGVLSERVPGREPS